MGGVQTDDAHHMLRILSAAFPNFPMTPDTTELYLAALTSQVASGDVGMQAAQEIATTQLYFPKVAELLEHCRAVGARKNNRTAGELPVGEPLPPEVNAERLAAMRAEMAGLFRRP